MHPVTFTTPHQQASISVSFVRQGRSRMTASVFCSFEPLEQRAFVDELDRLFFIERIFKPHRGEAHIFISLPPDADTEEVLASLEDIFTEYVTDNY